LELLFKGEKAETIQFENPPPLALFRNELLLDEPPPPFAFDVSPQTPLEENRKGEEIWNEEEDEDRVLLVLLLFVVVVEWKLEVVDVVSIKDPESRESIIDCCCCSEKYSAAAAAAVELLLWS
jgi:hypothetical protein